MHMIISLTELGLELMKEKQPMNFGQARSKRCNAEDASDASTEDEE